MIFTNCIQNEKEYTNSANELCKLYKNYLHNITPKQIDALAVLLLTGPGISFRIDSTGISPKFQCFILYVVLIHPCFWFVLCQSVLSCVLLCFVRVLLCLFLSMHTNMHTFTLHLKKKTSEKNFHFPFVLISKVQKLFIGWVDDNLTHLGMRVGLSINNHSSLAQRNKPHGFL